MTQPSFTPSRMFLTPALWLMLFRLALMSQLCIKLQAQDESSSLEWKVTRQANPRFTTFDVMVDPRNQPLAAYQLEIKTRQGNVQIVGIEGGSHAAFQQPPYYDPKALQKNRVILAAYNIQAAQNLPHTITRVATIHVSLTGPKTRSESFRPGSVTI